MNQKKQFVDFKLRLTKEERRSLRLAALTLGVSAAALVRSTIAPYIGVSIARDTGRASVEV